MLGQWGRTHRLRILTVAAYTDAATSSPTRLQAALWGGLLILALLLSLNAYHSFQLGTAGDDAVYTVLARSLVREDRYGLSHAPGEIGLTRYPFGYPLLLAPVVLLFPDSFDALKLVSLVATLLNAAIIFWAWPWFSRRSYWWGLAVSGLYLLAPTVIGQTRMVMSEPVFTTACLLAILLTERAARGESGRWWWLGLGAALMFAISIRTIGVVLMLACFAYLLLRQGRRCWRYLALVIGQVFLLVGLIVALTPVEIRNVVPTKYAEEYLSWHVFRDPAAGAAPHIGAAPVPPAAGPSQPEAEGHDGIETPGLRWVLDGLQPFGITVPSGHFLVEVLEAGELHVEQHIRSAVLPLGSGDREQALAAHLGLPMLPLLVGLATCGVIVLGYIRWYAQQGTSAFQLFSVLYLLALFVWLWRDPRFLNPVLPQLFLSFLVGVEAVLQALSLAARRRTTWPMVQNGALVALVALMLLGSVYKNSKLEDSRAHIGDLQARSSWLKANAASSAIVLSEHAELDYLYSDRKMVYPVGSYNSAAELEAYLAAHRIDYVLIAPHLRWQTDYRASYSKATARLLERTEELAGEGKVTLVYAPTNSLIRVYHVAGSH